MKIENKKFGEWTTIRELGTGGNGTVWLAYNSKGEEAAIKVLGTFNGPDRIKRYKRFQNEIKVLRENEDINGLLPILDLFAPAELPQSSPWYAMPVAQPLDYVGQDRKSVV